MASAEGYITVFEVSDGGDPSKALWQAFVGNQPVVTEDPRVAEMLRLAVKTNSRVRVTYSEDQNVLSQVRMEFTYLCEKTRVTPCGPVSEPVWICDTRRISRCDPDDPGVVQPG